MNIVNSKRSSHHCCRMWSSWMLDLGSWRQIIRYIQVHRRLKTFTMNQSFQLEPDQCCSQYDHMLFDQRSASVEKMLLELCFQLWWPLQRCADEASQIDLCRIYLFLHDVSAALNALLASVIHFLSLREKSNLWGRREQRGWSNCRWEPSGSPAEPALQSELWGLWWCAKEEPLGWKSQEERIFKKRSVNIKESEQVNEKEKRREWMKWDLNLVAQLEAKSSTVTKRYCRSGLPFRNEHRNWKPSCQFCSYFAAICQAGFRLDRCCSIRSLLGKNRNVLEDAERHILEPLLLGGRKRKDERQSN